MNGPKRIEVYKSSDLQFEDVIIEIDVDKKYRVAISKEPKKETVLIHLWSEKSGDWCEGVSLSDFRKELDWAENYLMTRSEYQDPEI